MSLRAREGNRRVISCSVLQSWAASWQSQWRIGFFYELHRICITIIYFEKVKMEVEISESLLFLCPPSVNSPPNFVWVLPASKTAMEQAPGTDVKPAPLASSPSSSRTCARDCEKCMQPWLGKRAGVTLSLEINCRGRNKAGPCWGHWSHGPEGLPWPSEHGKWALSVGGALHWSSTQLEDTWKAAVWRNSPGVKVSADTETKLHRKSPLEGCEAPQPQRVP